MVAIAFDALKFIQALRDKAKLTPEQAEGICQAFAEATSEKIATKYDLKLVQNEIALVHKEILASEMRSKISTGAMIFALGGVLIASKFFGQ